MKAKGLFVGAGVALLVVGALVVALQKADVGYGNRYSKTFEIEVNNFKDRKVCGILAGGGMKFKIPHPVYVKLATGTDSLVTSYIRINDTLSNEEFSVDTTGCVKLSFAYVSEFRERTVIDSQMIPVTFYR